MTGIVEMTRSFGLELLESILKKFPQVFASNDVFRVLLKERVCSLVIKLFSPNTKYRQHTMQSSGNSSPGDRPHYPITSKLLRVVSILILEYHHILTTETEIFISLLMKFLDPGKPTWQNCMALEVVHKIMVQPELLSFICSTFDMNEHSTKVFQDMINSLGAYVQNVMMTPGPADGEGQQGGAGGGSGGGTTSGGGGGSSVIYGSPGMSGFYYRNVWKPLTISFVGGQTKELYLDSSDRTEIPQVSDGYGISLAYACLLDAVRTMALVVNQRNSAAAAAAADLSARNVQLIDSSWCGILAALSLLLDASTEDTSTENILKAMENFASLSGHLGQTKPRDAYLASICKASLPPHYTLNVLKATPCTQTVSGPRNPCDAAAAATGGGGFGDSPGAVAGVPEGDIRHQVVAVGTPLPTASLPASAHQGPVMLTAKNLQCMRSILSVAHCHGNLLGNSWHIILTVSQLVWLPWVAGHHVDDSLLRFDCFLCGYQGDLHIMPDSLLPKQNGAHKAISSSERNKRNLQVYEVTGHPVK